MNDIRHYYRDFFSADVASVFNLLGSYYKKFPFEIVRELPPQVDHAHYFEQLIPLIVANETILAKNPPNLNVWQGFDVGRYEIRHCSFLAWLLDPSSNHCQKGLFLTCFAEYFGLHRIVELCNDGLFSVQTEYYYGDKGRVDVMISGSQFLILIEVKIDAPEQESQIERYDYILQARGNALGIPRENRILAFLTKGRSKPETGNVDITLDWRQIATICNNFSGRCGSAFLAELVKQYSSFLSNTFSEVKYEQSYDLHRWQH